MRSLWGMLFLATILMISVKASLAQAAQITGRISDSSGAVIQGAAVKVIKVDNGTQRDASSDVDGFYTVPLRFAVVRERLPGATTSHAITGNWM